MDEENLKKIEQGVRMILEAIGENPNREGLVDTPERVAKMYEEIFFGLREDPKEYFDIIYSEDHDELVLVKDIPFFSMCEHHLIPFYGKAHVAYFPQGGQVAGLSKLARAVESVASRPQLQERITATLADVIMDKLNPLGVFIMIEAEHMCMTMRGIKKPGTKTITSAARGLFNTNDSLRSEVLLLMKD
ncbi:GTP cyclohydrolase I FolE [Bacillus sp. FJAT-49736]|uniref:GTP cyclohydrolase I FolE n=1 Tax=Bacillus sp. FJAT-49736 TaxID=2833582 RepID=UPI001BC95F50|nr:GTP cyclohydrolase I FolE [Bacillus sp. FJAT-49736]MBS4173282.1 GTP cyclohydrolase I FolE [Bacillus sp. FJAT-49736]